MAGALVAWLLLGHYTRSEHVSGTLVPQAGLINVTAPAVGTLTRIMVSEGAVVHAGDPLLELSNNRSSASLGDTAANISKQLRRQKERLQADMTNAQMLAEQQARDLRMQQTMLQDQIGTIDTQIPMEQRHVTSLATLLGKFQRLQGQGYVSTLDIQQQETEELGAISQVKELQRQRFAAEQQKQSAFDQLQQLPLLTQAKLNDLHRQIGQVEQTLEQNEANRATVLHAPCAGVVSAMLVKPGQTTAPGQSLLTLAPRGSQLQAQLLVPSSAIGFVRRGTHVMLHYQAFPYQKFGVPQGTVTSISHSALSPDEVAVLLGTQPPPQPLYEVQVTLATQSIDAYGQLQALKPGMLLDANLMLDRRRLIEWIFEPLYGMRRQWAGSVR